MGGSQGMVSQNPQRVYTRHKGISRVVLVAGVLLLVFGFWMSTVEWPAVEGAVVDEATSEPIAGAIVIGNWSGTGGYSQTVCFHSESARSDNQGRFTLPAWRRPFRKLSNQQVIVVAYKKGYSLAPGWNRKRILMLPFTGTREERLKDLSDLAANTCSHAGSSKRNLYAFFKAIYLEAKELSVAQKDMENLNYFRYWAAQQAIAQDGDAIERASEYETRIKRFLEQNLR